MQKFKVLEVPTVYVNRVAGSYSKLNPRQDGSKVIKFIGKSFLKLRPALFCGLLALTFLVLGYLLQVPLFFDQALGAGNWYWLCWPVSFFYGGALGFGALSIVFWRRTSVKTNFCA